MMNTQIQGMFLGSNNYPMKIQHGRGLERNGAKVSKGGFAEEVAMELRLEFRKQKAGRKEGNTLKENHPLHRMGPHLGRGRGKGHPLPKGPCWAERVADKPDLSGPGFSSQRRKQADSPWDTSAPVWLTLLHSSCWAPFADQ